MISWLGWRDSNPRMLGPEPSALPLGDIPIDVLFLVTCPVYHLLALCSRGADVDRFAQEGINRVLDHLVFLAAKVWADESVMCAWDC